MASTYSSYKIELIGTGEQSGTWGTTTNNNFQYAIEQAIGGYATQALSTTSTTLTLSNTNALQNARALFLEFTGTPGSGATVVLPSIQKLYVIKNSITTYDLIVKTSTAPTITIPNGKTACVYVNGTDVVSANDYLTSLTTTSITASGAVTAAGNLSAGTVTAVSGTYSRSASSTSLAVTTASAHGLANGQQVYLDFTSGGATAEDGVYTIAVTGSTTFTVTTVLTTAVSGNVTVGSYANTFTLTAPISVPAVFGSSGTTGQVLSSQGTGMPPKWSTLSSNSISQGDSSVTVTDSGTGSISMTVDGTQQVLVNSSGAQSTNFLISANSGTFGYSNNSASILAYNTTGSSGTTNTLLLYASASERARITSNGLQVANALGIGTAASGTTGEIRATNNITAYYSSDARLKENVQVIPNALEKIQQLRGVTFDWTQEYISKHGGEDGYFIRQHDVGMIAQEVEKVLPELVADREDGYKAMKYDRVVALLVEAVKELKAELDSLKNEK